MPIESLQYVYTSQDEMERLISNSGLGLRLSDLAGANRSDYIRELCEEATDIVNQYLDVIYDEQDMADNRWIRARATWIGLVLLCRRRANSPPESFLDRYQEIIEDLQAVREGKRQVPRLPTRYDFTPAMSNLRVDDRYYTRKIRTNPSISTGGSSGEQDLDWWWSYDWF